MRFDDLEVTMAYLDYILICLQDIQQIPDPRERRIKSDCVVIATLSHLKDHLPLELGAYITAMLELNEAVWEDASPNLSKQKSLRPFSWLIRRWHRNCKPTEASIWAYAEHRVGKTVTFLLQAAEDSYFLEIGQITAIIAPNEEQPTCYEVTTLQDTYLVPASNILE